VPLDGSAESERILQWVRPLARRLDASVVLLAVLEQPGPNGVTTGMPRVADPAALAQAEGILTAAQRGRDRAMAYLRVVAQKTGLADAAVRTVVAFGSAGEMIAQVAGAEEADMIAMATRRESSLARGILGSATARVLQLHAAPALVVRVDAQHQAPGEDWPQNVLVPLDVSPLSECAVGPAISLAKALGAKLRFLRVTPRVYYPGIGGDIQYAGSSVFFGPELRKEAFEYLAPFVERAVSAGVDAFAEARSGAAAAQIVDVLHQLPASMAMMTSHGRGGLKRWALGSVTDKVIRSSAEPVMVLPPPQGLTE
jgi:nucleotide-binding universal stress UspA family protein